jgi:hypothetical protein
LVSACRKGQIAGKALGDCQARAPEDAMNDNNVLKFERRKPQQENKKTPKAPQPKKGLIWIAVLAVIVLVWAYYQFIAPQTL